MVFQASADPWVWSSPYILVGCVGGSAALLAGIIWRSQHDSLRHIPGPWLACVTPLWLWWISWSGIECRVIESLHRKHGAVVRIAPNEVDIADGAAIHMIYNKDGGYRKTSIYRNYDVEGFETIFSTLSPTHRALRAKAVAPMFAHQNVTHGKTAISVVIGRMVDELQRRRTESNGSSIDVLNLFRAVAMDTITVYLFGESINSVGRERFYATEFIDSFASGGRMFNLPGWMYNLVDSWLAKFDRNKAQSDKSTAFVRSYAAKVVDRSLIANEKANGTDQTYQARLIAAGVSREEAISQVMDVIFAGTDAAGTTLSMLCWNLVKHPEEYERVYQECRVNPDTDARSLPHLSGVVKESLRLSVANPTRLPRVVPEGGMSVPDLPRLPAGVHVGIGAYSLHYNPKVFPKPRDFVPERWLSPTPEMLRDSFAFGAGTRQCIGQSLASAQLWWSAEAIIRSDVLRGGRIVAESIDTKEWFNVKVAAGKIELRWPACP